MSVTTNTFYESRCLFCDTDTEIDSLKLQIEELEVQLKYKKERLSKLNEFCSECRKEK